MLTEDIIEVKKNKKKYKMGYSPDTLSYKHKVKDIYEAEKKDTKKEPAKKDKKKHRDPLYQRMINRAKAQLPYVKMMLLLDFYKIAASMTMSTIKDKKQR